MALLLLKESNMDTWKDIKICLGELNSWPESGNLAAKAVHTEDVSPVEDTNVVLEAQQA